MKIYETWLRFVYEHVKLQVWYKKKLMKEALGVIFFYKEEL